MHALTREKNEFVRGLVEYGRGKEHWTVKGNRRISRSCRWLCNTSGKRLLFGCSYESTFDKYPKLKMMGALARLGFIIYRLT
jgi:hypothetical protein